MPTQSLVTLTPLPQSLSNFAHLSQSPSLTMNMQKFHGIKRESSKKLTFGNDDGDGEVWNFLLRLFHLGSFAVSQLGFFFCFRIRVSWWSPLEFFQGFSSWLPLLLYQQLRVLVWLMEIHKGFLRNPFRVVRFWSPYLIVKFGRGNTELHFLLWILSQFRFGLFFEF